MSLLQKITVETLKIRPLRLVWLNGYRYVDYQHTHSLCVLPEALV